jgi:ABC-type Fe3+/spermidine/putrescine transport system ATPase subunit
VFITHDQEEALFMSNRVAVMHAGRILQVASPRGLYEAPGDPFIADFVGEATLWRASIKKIVGDKATVCVAPTLTVTARARDGYHAGDEVLLVLRPELPRPADTADAAENRVRGTVSEALYLGGSVRYRVALPGGVEMLVRWPARRDHGLAAVGDRIELAWSAHDMHLIPVPP